MQLEKPAAGLDGTRQACEAVELKPLRAVDLLVDELVKMGVTHVFGVGGANIEDFYDALHANAAVTGILAKHEFSAGTMADGYARTTGRLGVAATTSGGGALNLVPALGEAYTSRIPLLALVGQPPTGLDGRGSFQDSSGHNGSLDAERVFAPVARYCSRVRLPSELARRLAEAVSAALSPPSGPAVLLLPKDVQQGLTGPLPVVPPRPRADPTPLAHELAHVVAVLETARAANGVLVIAGTGVARADARDFLAWLVDALDARVAVTPDAKDVFDNRDRRFVGVTGGMGNPSVADALAKASACLLVGTRLPVMSRDGLDALLTRVHVLCVAEEQPHVDARTVLGALRSTLPPLIERLKRERPGAVDAASAPHLRRLPTSRSAGGIGYREAMAAIEDALPSDAHVFVDAGNCGAAAIHHLAAPQRGRFVVTLGMGGMGYSFGSSIGASLADTNRPSRVYVIAGDGAFYMHGFELHTAIQYELPITYVIFNNNAHAMCVTREQVFYGGGYSYNRFSGTCLADGVGAMFPTLVARNASTPEELVRCLAETRTTRGPVFVSVDCDVDEIPPVSTFLSKEMVPCPR